jgi:TolB-like protein/DNA-binding winged helix-turn-helix (wHTH) protein/Flp pilus assembly protein TadD
MSSGPIGALCLNKHPALHVATPATIIGRKGNSSHNTGMADEVLTTPLLRFGVFELDLQTGELRKSGRRIRLAPQPFKLLVLLASRPGELLTREEIQRQIWGDNTVVDYEQGLSFLVKKVRAALGDRSLSPRYIETLPRRGYRFIAPVEAGNHSGDAPVADAVEPDGHPTPALSRWRGSWLVGAGLVAIAAVLVVLNVWGLRDRILEMFSPRVHSIAVLPVKNLSGDPGQEYFADGMTDGLITELSRIGGLRVIGLTSVMVYKGSEKPVREIAGELKVDRVLEASMLRSGGRVRINLHLVDGSTEHVLWEETFERNLGDILTLYSAVAGDVAGKIRIALTPEERQRLAGARPVKPEAYEAYLRGRYLLNKRTSEDINKGIDYFEQAVKIDPNYAPAYAGIADSYVLLEYYGPIPIGTSSMKARVAARKAVELDESLAEGHTALALVSFRYDLDWNTAGKEFRRALALNPGNARAHLRYAMFLMYLGRNKEACTEGKEAQKLEPLSLIINSDYGTALFFSGEYGRAVQQWQKTLDLNPNFWITRFWLGYGYIAKGLHQQGLHELESAVELSKGHPSTLAWLGYAYAVSGKTDKAREILARLQQKAKEGYVPSFEIAVVHAGLGEKDQAFRYLEKAFQERYIGMFFLNLKGNLLWRPLHSDPRYQDLLRRMNFPLPSPQIMR